MSLKTMPVQLPSHQSAKQLGGWGRYPLATCVTHVPRSVQSLKNIVCNSKAIIARGAGRAYGDCALQAQGVVHTEGMSNTLMLDEVTGVLVANAGATFAEVLALSVTKGWFVPVTPGTKYVTLGGAVAADAHGKNHHVDGSFGDHLLWLDLINHEGNKVRCSDKENQSLFSATIGGMGLTGIIDSIALKMRPIETAWVREETVLAPNLEAAVEAFEASNNWKYSVAWIDAMARGPNLGRCVLFRGEHALIEELPAQGRASPLNLPSRRKPLRIPVDAPGILLNKYSAQIFNSAYWLASRRKAGTRIVNYEDYFYPLDSLLDWNRLYGRRGFVQYQCVLPLENSLSGMREILNEVLASGLGAFLAVLKLMGQNTRGGLSFPMEGYTLALDFPVTPQLPRLLERLDFIVCTYEGRIYLAKDARMSAETFQHGYSDIESFENIRRLSGASEVFKSHQSERLGLS